MLMKRSPLLRATKPLKRAPMKRRIDSAALNPGDFLLETAEGRVWRWPSSWMSEADWQGTVEDWAVKVGDRDTQLWHCRNTRESQKGWFDLAIFQPNRKKGLLTELKVRDRKGVANTPSVDQWAFIYAGIACGYDVRVLTFPDDAFAAWEAVTGRPREDCPYWRETKAMAL
jgi:hypothetical protein